MNGYIARQQMVLWVIAALLLANLVVLLSMPGALQGTLDAQITDFQNRVMDAAIQAVDRP